MIVGTGIDVVEIDRIDRLYTRYGERALRHLLTPAEREKVTASADPVARLAGRFAAKEAVMKALGTGARQGVNFTNIEIVNEPGGRPTVRLYGAAAERSGALGGRIWHVSISHGRLVAVAHAVLES